MPHVLVYRRGEPRDEPLVVGSWTDSYRTAHGAGLISMDDWDAIMRVQVAKILARPGCEVWVASNPSETDGRADLYGWLALEQDVWIPTRAYETRRWEEHLAPADCPLVHYVFVKQAYRRMGVARGLFHAARVDPFSRFLFSCKTGTSAKIEHALGLKGQWAPLICRFPKQRPQRSAEDERRESTP